MYESNDDGQLRSLIERAEVKLLIQPNRWSCLPTAIAMVLDISIDEVIRIVGHDGSRIQWHNQSEPSNRRSFHVQEMVKLCLIKNHLAVSIECSPTIINEAYTAFEELGRLIQSEFYTQTELVLSYSEINDQILELTDLNKVIIFQKLEQFDGVLLGERFIGRHHAVAWNHKEQMIYDPSGTCYPLYKNKICNFEIHQFLLIKSL